jgi:outer membrane protein OmpA-like peptidoglycan-associated protein
LVKIKSGETYKSKKLYFSPNDLTIKDFNLKEIELIANALKEYPELTVNFSNSDYFTENKNPVSNQIKNSAVELIKKLGIDETRIFTDLSPDSIENNVLQYTIFDKISVQNAIAEKAKRLNQDYVSKIKDVTFTAENILFEFAQNTVKIDANPELNKLAEYLTKNPESVIQITAYADAVGNTDFNKKLSEKRALMIQNYLISKGVGKNQTTIRGSGEENPLTLNMINGQWNENSKRFNRRAEFKVIKQGTQTIKIVQFQNIPEEYKNPNYNSEY